MNIAILGGGNLGKSIAQGLIENNYTPANITITRNRIELLNNLKAKGVNVSNNNVEATQNAQVVIIAVKTL